MDALKKLLLAAVGGTTLTYETASRTLEKLIDKGQISVDEGKVLNEDLKHFVKEHAKTTPANDLEAKDDRIHELEDEVSDLHTKLDQLIDEVHTLKGTNEE